MYNYIYVYICVSRCIYKMTVHQYIHHTKAFCSKNTWLILKTSRNTLKHPDTKKHDSTSRIVTRLSTRATHASEKLLQTNTVSMSWKTKFASGSKMDGQGKRNSMELNGCKWFFRKVTQTNPTNHPGKKKNTNKYMQIQTRNQDESG